MTKHFKFDEFYKPEFKQLVTKEIQEKLLVHMHYLEAMRKELKSSIKISKRSGFRPRTYEIDKGRSGTSQHCFLGLGAVDITCSLEKLHDLWEIAQESSYTRVCLYPSKHFIHCDLKGTTSLVFLCEDGVNWERVSS